MLFRAAATTETKRQGLALHATPTDRMRDLWVGFVIIKRKNFFPQPHTKFVIHSVHLEENCFT